MRFLSVGPRICLQLPSDSTSRWTPLLFSYTFPTTWACSGLLPARARPWRANETCAARRTQKRCMELISLFPYTFLVNNKFGFRATLKHYQFKFFSTNLFFYTFHHRSKSTLLFSLLQGYCHRSAYKNPYYPPSVQDQWKNLRH